MSNQLPIVIRSHAAESGKKRVAAYCRVSSPSAEQLKNYGIIWRAVADASKLYLEKGISKKHAANSVIGARERYAERAKINGWDLTQYNRIKDLPQSELSLFHFNRVLGIGEMGFRVPPTIV